MARRRSNTMGNKLKQINNQQTGNEKSTQSMILQQPSSIKIIIRRTNKPSRVVQIPESMSGTKLFELVEKEYYIEQQKQTLFFKGQRIEQSRETLKQTLSFSERDILHVHNKQLFKRESISIYLQFLNTDYVKFQQTKITANSGEIIRTILQDYFIYQIQDIDKYLYIQSGRLINISRRLFQQAIEDDSIIIVIAATQKFTSFRKLEQRQMEIVESKTKLTKRSSLNYLDRMDTPDFKKKVKAHVYKSMMLPEGKQIVWEEDTNSEFSKKILLKRLTKKKTIKPRKKQSIKQIIKQSQNLSISNISNEMSSSYKNSKISDKQFQQNFKIVNKSRLFCSQILPKGKDLLDLKPPPTMMEDDDDFQEVQQIDFGQNLSDNNRCAMNCNDRYDCLKASAPLRDMQSSLTKSIGKLRGDFLLPVLPFGNNKLDSDDSDDSNDSDDKIE